MLFGCVLPSSSVGLGLEGGTPGPTDEDGLISGM